MYFIYPVLAHPTKSLTWRLKAQLHGIKLLTLRPIPLPPPSPCLLSLLPPSQKWLKWLTAPETEHGHLYSHIHVHLWERFRMVVVLIIFFFLLTCCNSTESQCVFIYYLMIISTATLCKLQCELQRGERQAGCFVAGGHFWSRWSYGMIKRQMIKRWFTVRPHANETFICDFVLGNSNQGVLCCRLNQACLGPPLL